MRVVKCKKCSNYLFKTEELDEYANTYTFQCINCKENITLNESRLTIIIQGDEIY